MSDTNKGLSVNYADIQAEMEAQSSEPIYTDGATIVDALALRSKKKLRYAEDPESAMSKGAGMIKLTFSHANWGTQTKNTWVMCEGGGVDTATGLKRLVLVLKLKLDIPTFDTEGGAKVPTLIGKKMKIKEEWRVNKDETDGDFDGRQLSITGFAASH